MSQATGGEAIVQAFLAHGVDTLFGLPGVQSDWLYNALYDLDGAIRVIHSRHEQGAGYMALGYAMSTGKVGVYSVVPGPGFLNASSALATAYSTNSKVLCFSGQIRSDLIGRGTGQLHEIPDQMAIMRSLTKWAARIMTPAEAPELVTEAFHQLHSGRPRPVGLEAPMDVLAARGEVDLRITPRAGWAPPVDLDALDEAARLLGRAKNPLIFVGMGAIESAEEIRQLAEDLQAPVVSSRSGHGILSSRHPLSLRTPAAHRLWKQADVVLALGTRMQRILNVWGTDKDLKIIRIDIDREEFFRNETPTVGIVARCEDAVPALVELVGRYNHVRADRATEYQTARAAAAADLETIQPQLSFIHAMRDALPDNGLFVDDLTQVGYVSRTAMPIYEPRTYLGAGYQGTLGWSMATALGAQAAHPDRPVLAIAGDGGFMFTVQELATAVQHGLNTVTVVYNDSAFGNVMRMQKQQYDGRVIATDLRNPDFVKLAEAFGALGLRAHTPAELTKAIEQGFTAGVPTIIEVPVGEMPSPWRTVFMPKVR